MPGRPPASSSSAAPSPPDAANPTLQWGRIGAAVGWHILTFVAVIASAFVAMRLISLPPTHITVVWLPAGIALLALRSRLGFTYLPTILLAHWAVIALANDYAFLSFRPWSLLMAASNTAGPALALLFWRRWVRRDPFDDPFEFLRWVGVVAFLPALLTSWVIPAVIITAGYLPDASVADVAKRIISITLSSTLGVFLVAPIGLANWRNDDPSDAPTRLWVRLANLLAAIGISILGYNVTPVGLYLGIPYALAATVVCGSRGLGIGLFIFISYGLLATAHGYGPFAQYAHDPLRSLVEMAAAALCLGIPAHFAGMTLRQLRRHRRNLEAMVSERTRELNDSEEAYRLATDIVSVGVFRWEGGQLNLFFNTPLRRKVRHLIQPGTMAWTRIWRHLHPEDRAAARTALRGVLRGQSDLFHVDTRLRLVSGEWGWFQTRGQVMARDARGRPQRMIGTFCDIDEEKKRISDLTADRDRANARTEAKDAFLANISHEIRTPMHAMLGFARILEGTPLDPKQAECVEAITSSGDLLLQLLNDLLDLSRIEAGAITLDPQSVDPVTVVRQSVKLFEQAAQHKNLRLVTHVAPDLPSRLHLDATRVRQVISNLVSNAVKFTEHGGVEVRLTGSRLPASSPEAAPGWRLTIEVLDTGIGIEPRHLHRLFNPFSQADETIHRRFGGTGLGLALSRRLCELMGGTITVTSNPTAGSVFAASFQGTVPATPSDTSPPAETTITPSRQLQVLVVEDDRLNRRLAEMMLQRLDHQPSFAFDGRAALQQLEQQRYDVVLMDLNMPELDGIETTLEIRRREAATQAPRTPIIALTANAGRDERDRCLRAGMDDYLTKPLDLPTIRETLDRISASSSSSARR